QPFSVVLWDQNKKPVTKSMTATPAQVTVKMVIQADAITVDKAVGFTVTGQPAAGYRLVNVTIAPLLVQATGLQNTLAGLVLLATDPIDLTGAKADIVKTVTIRPPDGVTTNQKTAQVHVFISPIPGAPPRSTRWSSASPRRCPPAGSASATPAGPRTGVPPLSTRIPTPTVTSRSW